MRFFVIIFLIVCFVPLRGQDHEALTLPQAIDIALKNNAGVHAAAFDVQAKTQIKKTGVDLPKTDVVLLYGQYNSFQNDNNITISQSIPFTVFGSQGSLNRSLLASSEIQKAVVENEVVYHVKMVHNHLAYTYSKRKMLESLDSIYEGFYRSATARHKAGEANLLEQTTAEVQYNELKDKLRQNDADISALRSQLKALLRTPSLPDIALRDLQELPAMQSMDTTLLLNNPSLAHSRQQVVVAENERKLQSAKMAPDLLVGYFNQTMIGTPDPENGTGVTQSTRFSGLQVGVSLPLWFVPHQGKVKAASLQRQAAEMSYENNTQNLQVQFHTALQYFNKNKMSLGYYRSSALPNADLILKQSQIAFRAGEIGYAEYLMGLRNAASIKENYLLTLSEYNQNIIFLEFLSGNK
jgi:cobalt-zinc-cadmium resistance protein CzcA